ncbi:NADPH-dependent FMN reductase [Streptomyces sp. NBC_00342]|uniref:NADPH-dependent FMN reductase n=1 Tax=Streptomyces sp. NBC_00342 TaxID=2975718 RepID=UPI002E2E5FF5|nr:NAD(P)H-dependent oxidoreductase [Streptomyces sp. NBC_00342]
MDDQVDRLRLVILVGAAREDRFGLATAEWLGARARLRQDFEVDVIDLATAWLPDLMAADPTAPLPSAVRDLCPWLAGADAFAVVTQEYRFGCYGGAREVRGGRTARCGGPGSAHGPTRRAGRAWRWRPADSPRCRGAVYLDRVLPTVQPGS